MRKCAWNESSKGIIFCVTMTEAFNEHYTRQGLTLFPITNHKTMKQWLLPAIKSGTFKKEGVQIEWCPFCGAHLTPMLKKWQKAAAVQKLAADFKKGKVAI
jgi:hypothetical protein